MKGDFSRLDYDPQENFTGVWHQQGRVLTDQDWNAGTRIAGHLRELMGRDAFGPATVAVPAQQPDALRVLALAGDGSRVRVQLQPGRCWIDGLPLHLAGEAPLELVADYLGPPQDATLPDAGSIAAGVRDAVVLEAWEEAFSAFQERRPQRDPADPDRLLLEPALGGPDTTERARLQYRLRLLRLAPGEECGNLGRLADDLAARGRLSVSPEPGLGIEGECPLELGGGFTGFEHALIRIEIDQPDAAGNARFKWSRFNGGLVGRGVYDAALSEVAIEANDQAINHCGLTEFWFELLAHDPEQGHWRRYMAADASLVADGRLQLANVTGAPPAAGEPFFFRLWDGIRLVSDFAAADPVTLALGLQLQFDPPAADNANYRPGDYWAFPVRTAGVDFDPALEWPDRAPPQGLVHHRAPLAIVTWHTGPVVTENGPPAILDCRRLFQPLTRLQGCCSLRVGDGRQSFGDFDSIQAAIDHLPADRPGEICVLPGTYVENLRIDRDDLVIRGCGRDRSLLVSGEPAEPVIRMAGHSGLTVADLTLEAHPEAAGIELLELAMESGPARPARDIGLSGLRLRASGRAAVLADGVARIRIRDCVVEMDDVPGPWPGIYLRGDDALLEHNRIVTGPRLHPAGPREGLEPGIAGDDAAPVVVGRADPAPEPRPEMNRSGRGGLQIGGGSERVEVIDNRIAGGIGNGITLGSLVEVDEQGNQLPGPIGWVINRFDPCDPCAPGDGYQPPPDRPGDPRFESEGALYDLRIERNRIERMGLNGIGVVAFFDLAGADELISVIRLSILGNRIHHCLSRELAPIPQTMRRQMGYGGISLADVEYLRLYDNRIEHNGPDQRQTVCGVFLLHVAGLDACRNRIRNNGAKTPQGEDNLLPGPRGGIVVIHALPGIDPILVAGQLRPRQNGVPAIRIHDNQISQPLGQALFLHALGPVSVQDNQLTCQGTILDATDPGFWATTVFVFNLGWSNEFYLQTLLFNGATGDPLDAGSLPVIREGFTPEAGAGLDDDAMGRYMANGNVLFAGNQVFTDLIEAQVDYAVSSTLLVSLDDVTVQNNQFDCDFLADFLFSNLIAAGVTLRIQDNRFKESLFVTLYSSLGLGLLFNNTSDNQATHCIVSLESPLGAWFPLIAPDIEENHNQVLFDAFNLDLLGSWCERLAGIRNLLVRGRKGGAVAGNPGATILNLLQ